MQHVSKINVKLQNKFKLANCILILHSYFQYARVSVLKTMAPQNADC